MDKTPAKIEFSLHEDAIDKDPMNVDVVILDKMGNKLTNVIHHRLRPGIYDVDLDDSIIPEVDDYEKLIYEDENGMKKTAHIF